MRGQHQQAGIVNIDQQHEGVIERRVFRRSGIIPAQQIAQRQHRLVAMVAVGDEDLPCTQRRSDARADFLVIAAPENFLETVAGGARQRRRRRRLCQQLADYGVTAVKQTEDGTEAGLAGAHQLQPIFLRSFQRPFVREHITLVERLQADSGKKTVAHTFLLADAKPFLKGIKTRRRLHVQRAVSEPFRQRRPRAGVAIVIRRVGIRLRAVFQPNDIMRIARVEFLLHLR